MLTEFTVTATCGMSPACRRVFSNLCVHPSRLFVVNVVFAYTTQGLPRDYRAPKKTYTRSAAQAIRDEVAADLGQQPTFAPR